MFVRKATLEYLGSARLRRRARRSACAAPASATRRWCSSAGAFRQEQLLVSGELIYVFADPDGKAPQAGAAPSCARCSTSFEARRVDGRRARRQLARARAPLRGRSAPRCSSASRRSRPRWNGTTPTPTPSTPSPSTASAARWPPAGCSSTCPASPRSAGWRSPRASRHSGVGRAVLDALLDAARSARRPRGGAACAARRRAVLRARRLRPPRAGVRRGRHRPRRDAARALSAGRCVRRAGGENASTWRGPSMTRCGRAPRRSASIAGVDAAVDAAARARQRVGLHPGLQRRAVAGADQQARVQSGMRLAQAVAASPGPRGARSATWASSTR